MVMSPWEKFQSDWSGKKILIMGLGLQGRGIGDAGILSGVGAHVTVTDLKNEEQLRPALQQLKDAPIRYVLGRHEIEDFRSHDMVLRNPDVPSSSPFLKIARDSGIPIKMDSSLFATYCPFPIVGVTGTRGKTTTTMMINEILKKRYKGCVYLGGNIPGKATLELLREIERGKRDREKFDSVVVLELSSWELQGWEEEKISPSIAIFTNLYEDHLNRYSSMEEYFQDKLAIFRHQKKSDWAILNQKNSWTNKARSVISAQVKWFCGDDLPSQFSLQIPGDHNRANAAAAVLASEAVGIKRQDALRALESFHGVPFRLETIATIDGIDYINDTTSTTPAAGIAALRAMNKPIVLIAGGSSKKLNLLPFAQEIVKRVKHVVFLKGEGTDEMLREIPSSKFQVPNAERVYGNFERALEKARSLASPGDIVLLSPGCASFSMFQNEFDRGEQFNSIISSWQKKNRSRSALER